MDTPNLNTSPGTGTDRLMADLQAVVRDTENLLKRRPATPVSVQPRRGRMPKSPCIGRGSACRRWSSTSLRARARRRRRPTNTYTKTHGRRWASPRESGS